jgi:hypothetical protein
MNRFFANGLLLLSAFAVLAVRKVIVQDVTELVQKLAASKPQSTKPQ